MNLYFKYCPLGYTIRTRFFQNKIEKMEDWSIVHHQIKWWIFNIDSINYIYSLGIWLFPPLAIYLSWWCSMSVLIQAYLLYLYNYIVFLVFYEIWYFYNDLQAEKKEKKPTFHINCKLPKNFYLNNIIIRILLWILLLIPLYLFDNTIFFYFLILILSTQLIFFIHNTIRKYFYNWITLFLLRFLKMSQILIPMYYILWTSSSEFYIYTIVVFLIGQYYTSFLAYSRRSWFQEKNLWLPQWLLQHGYNTFAMFILYIFTFNYIFLIYGFIYLCLFIKVTPKWYFKLENDR